MAGWYYIDFSFPWSEFLLIEDELNKLILKSALMWHLLWIGSKAIYEPNLITFKFLMLVPCIGKSIPRLKDESQYVSTVSSSEVI